MPTIQKFVNDKNKYKVDHTYQRPVDAWSKIDKQCLIDTILKGEPIPLFFMNYQSEEDKFYIVDGQQRLHCIQQFYENKFSLNKKFSGEKNHGLTFNGEKALSDDQKEKFLDYKLNFHIMEDYDDERVYVSDIKKVIKWYAILAEHNLITEPVEEEEETEESGESEESSENVVGEEGKTAADAE